MSVQSMDPQAMQATLLKASLNCILKTVKDGDSQKRSEQPAPVVNYPHGEFFFHISLCMAKVRILHSTVWFSALQH